jgi:hypothetical protein
MRGMASKPILRLYTHQGAMIGFNVGFGMVFIIALVFHNFGVSHFPVLLAGLAATWPVILGSASARQVPINLWRAYGDLRFKDGAIFFVIGLFGPLFGLFFFSYSEILLSPESGISILILAIGLLTGAMTYYRRRTGSSIIPPSTFVLLFGGLYWLLELAQGKGVFELTAFACLLTSIVVSLKLDQVPFSLGGGILLLGLSVSLWVVQKTVPGLVWMVVILAGFAWWRWGKNYVWFPLSFWLVIGGIITAGVLIQHFFLSILLASIGLAVFTFGVIFIQLYLARRNRTEKSEPK